MEGAVLGEAKAVAGKAAEVVAVEEAAGINFFIKKSPSFSFPLNE